MKPLAARLLTLLLAVSSAALAGSPNVVISQIYGAGGNSGSNYSNDYVELYNTSSSDVVMTNWQVAYASAAGTSWTNRTIFSGTVKAHGYFLIQEASGGANGSALPTPDVTGGTINMSASAGKVALLNNNTAIGAISCPVTSGTTGLVDFAGYGSTANCFEGTTYAPGPANATSSVTRQGGPADTDQNGTDFASQAANPHNSGGAASVSISALSPTSAVSGSGSFTLTITGSGISSPATVNFNANPLTPTSTSATQVVVTVPGTLIVSGGMYPVTVTSGGATSNALTFTVSGAVSCTETHTIAQVQGSGNTSPYVGTTQTSQGIVTLIRSSGFFMQMATGDGDPTTSDGVYVFTSTAPTVAVGDAACVTGTVTEYSGGATTDPVNSLTEFDSPTVTKLSSGNALPAAVAIAPTANGGFFQLERYESMRVSVSSLTSTGPTGGTLSEANATSTSNGSFWGVVTGTPRPFREPGVEASHPIAATLPACCFTIFDGNPEKIEIYTGNPGVTKVDVVAGAVITGISGVLDVYQGDYELDVEPSATLNVTNNTLPIVTTPTQLASELTVATFNLERFYDNVDDPSVSDVKLTDAAYLMRKQKASLAIRNVIHTPDILGVEEMENLTTLQSLAAQISADAVAAGQTDPQYQAYLVEGRDIGGIDVGFLVNPNRVNVNSVTQLGFNATYTDPNTGNPAPLNDRPPLVLTGTGHNGAAAGLPITVIVNHLKALPADDPTDTRVRVKREAQAEFLANIVQSRQTANPNELIAVLGDLNAFEFNDGMADVVGVLSGTPAPSNQDLVPGPSLLTQTLTELSSAYLPANQRYSYVESGNAQQLDHILVNPKALARISRFAIGHVNAEYPEIFRNDATRPERFSDHDPEVAYFNLPAASDVTASLTVTRSGLLYNRATQLYGGTLTIQNTTASAIGSPVQVFFNGLPAGVTLNNATGNLGGVPYITTGAIGANSSVTISLQFRITGNTQVSYTNTAYSGTL